MSAAASSRDRSGVRRGLRIALVGPDGAGKSTLASGLQGELPAPTTIIRMGQLPGLASPHVDDPLHVPIVSFAIGTVIQWARWIRGWLLARGGSNVIFDRYTEEALLVDRPDAPARRRVARIVRRVVACPRPDLLVVLDAPATMMFERKGELTPADLDVDRARYLEFATRLRLPVIRTDDSPRLALDRVLAEIAPLLDPSGRPPTLAGGPGQLSG